MEYDKFVLISEDAEENLSKLSEAQISGIASLIADNIRRTEMKIRQEMGESDDTMNEMKKHQLAYNLYLELVNVLIGYDVEIALMALSKCKINLIMADDDKEAKGGL